MNRVSTEHKSKAAELLATSYLLERGAQVSYPIATTSYDLLVTNPSGLSKRIQVKRGYMKAGTSGVHVNLVRPGSGKRYRSTDADYLMVVCVSVLAHTVWIIPFSKVHKYSRLVVSNPQWSRYKVVSSGLNLGRPVWGTADQR